ncbi:uncharacterized protein DUF3558 [Prauserella shujinwangii]|uniref:Uncharacterized protein DUF3558 n=1 Tax=Prauserella shujinwangii TaxID=1453103 RepID=A0A2T0LVV8_9PSEU|nr:DUF3558 family protein [Prauserella shujinwangii]PRX47937.1 uncharacterized protein DUF3558 [Prauserella shujinwangii]
MRKSTRALLLPLAVAALAVAACSNSESGMAKPKGSTDSPTQPSSSAATETPVGSGRALSDELTACSLLNQQELAQFGEFRGGQKPSTSSASDACQWSGGDVSNVVTVGVAIRDAQSVDEVSPIEGGGAPTTGQLAGRRAVQASAPTGCLLALSVGDSSRVDVVISGETEEPDYCQLVGQVADIVEPKLPEG